MNDYEELCNSLSMTEIIRLRDLLSKALTRRFERPLALAFSDVVGSTPYFARFGDEAGRSLQQRHIDLVTRAIVPRQGRIVDTAGDGAFLCFPDADLAADALVELHQLISSDNFDRAYDHQLAIRIGLHVGPVLTDGTLVSGDAVNFCARVASSANPGEIRVSKEAFLAFQAVERKVQCRMLMPVMLKGITRPAELLLLRWRDSSIFPASVRLQTGQEFPLPEQDTITFGRLREKDGRPANDIVLQFGGEESLLNKQISRWHFELRRRPDGFVLRPVSDGVTEIDGRPVKKGEEVAIRPGTVVRVGNVMEMTFESAVEKLLDASATIFTIPGELASS